jgi:hypothetical protein
MKEWGKDQEEYTEREFQRVQAKHQAARKSAPRAKSVPRAKPPPENPTTLVPLKHPSIREIEEEAKAEFKHRQEAAPKP